MPREEVVKWRLQEGKEGYVPSQRDKRENTGVPEDIRFMLHKIMYDTLSEGKRNNNNYDGWNEKFKSELKNVFDDLLSFLFFIVEYIWS